MYLVQLHPSFTLFFPRTDLIAWIALQFFLFDVLGGDISRKKKLLKKQVCSSINSQFFCYIKVIEMDV